MDLSIECDGCKGQKFNQTLEGHFFSVGQTFKTLGLELATPGLKVSTCYYIGCLVS